MKLISLSIFINIFIVSCYESSISLEDKLFFEINSQAEQNAAPQQTESPLSLNSTIEFNDDDLRVNLITGNMKISFDSPDVVSSAKVWIGEENGSITSSESLATLTSFEAENIIALEEMPFPGENTYLILEVFTADDQRLLATNVFKDRTPKDIEGIKSWLKSDVGVLDLNGDAASHGVNVATWQDQSGNNNHFLQNVDGKRPSFQDDGGAWVKNGYPSILFNGYWGGGENLEFGSSFKIPSTFIIAAKYSGSTSGNNSIIGSGVDLEVFFDLYGGWAGYATAGQPETAPAEWASFGIRLGKDKIRGAYGIFDYELPSAFPETPFDMLYLGSRGKSFAWNGGNTVQHFDGAISEVIWYERSLSDEEFVQLRLYIKNKYGIK